MNLYYHFEDIECNVLESEVAHINNQWFEPHYTRKDCAVDYKYEVDVSFQDFFDYVKTTEYSRLSNEGKLGYERAIKDIWNCDLFRLEDLEEDEDFIEYMQARYKDEAREKCIDENDW